jgi:hypothetical protein
MNNFLKTKQQKIWATVSVIWIFLTTLFANLNGYHFEWSIFLYMGFLPVVLGWTIYFIWKK